MRFAPTLQNKFKNLLAIVKQWGYVKDQPHGKAEEMTSLDFEIFGDGIKLTDPITGEHEYTIKRREVITGESESSITFEVWIGESNTDRLWKTIEAAEFYALALKADIKGDDCYPTIQSSRKTGSIPKS